MKAILLLIAAAVLSFDGIYNYQITDIDGNMINISDFQGKKILFVNTASNSEYVNQYASLEELYQKYKDSLVVIAMPSDAYGNEPLDNDSIKNFVQSNYTIHYILGSKTNVTGDSSNMTPVYWWLTHKSEFNLFQNPVNGDFYKYLVNGNGQMIAVFAGSMDPMDSLIQNVITTPNDY